MYAENTVLVVGQAKPSREDAIYNLHGEFYISLVVERDTGRILDVDCNTILSVTKNFVASMFVGKNLRTDTEVLEREIKERYFALTQKPLIACMKDAHNRYMMACQGPRQGGGEPGWIRLAFSPAGKTTGEFSGRRSQGRGIRLFTARNAGFTPGAQAAYSDRNRRCSEVVHDSQAGSQSFMLFLPYDGGETEALSDLSFQVQTGEFLAVVGPSGCGKPHCCP